MPLAFILDPEVVDAFIEDPSRKDVN
jgi:hypothetical protein